MHVNNNIFFLNSESYLAIHLLPAAERCINYHARIPFAFLGKDPLGIVDAFF